MVKNETMLLFCYFVTLLGSSLQFVVFVAVKITLCSNVEVSIPIVIVAFNVTIPEKKFDSNRFRTHDLELFKNFKIYLGLGSGLQYDLLLCLLKNPKLLFKNIPEQSG